ncbi:MAG: 4Fe-4S dicluster domain-containing protein [Ancrocorticia sp.]|uniref:4Fe-4S dicluster domain-containing protein n=1 Tax=Ancrocorticia sp. TaxID=2593684 RepID=UPI003F908EA3
MHLGMIVDTERCIGCDTCAIACKTENNLPDDVWWNNVWTVGGAQDHTPAATPGRPTMWFLTVACQQCENPPCVPVCPTGATYKREKDGVVLIDYDKCIGCGACVEACPYDGVRTRNADVIQRANPFSLGGYDIQPQQPATVSKCTFCEQRLEENRQPACVEVCPARARFFGDLDDPESEVSQLLETRESFTLHPEAGTKPSVHFLK